MAESLPRPKHNPVIYIRGLRSFKIHLWLCRY